MKIGTSSWLMLTILLVLLLYSQSDAVFTSLAEPKSSSDSSIKIPLTDAAVSSATNSGEPAIELSLIDTVAAPNRYINIPLFIKGVADFDIISALIQIQFDSTCLLGVDVINQGTLTEGWQPPIVNYSGTSLYIALAGAQPLSKDSVLIYLRFYVNPRAKENQECNLIFTEVILNEGGMNVITRGGHFRIRGLQIAGTIVYQGTKVPVPDVRLQLSGAKELAIFSDENGDFNFTQIPFGNFVLTPRKIKDQAKCISPFDAALILQSVLGINQLSPYQRIAADVSGDGAITTFDAALIMKYSVNLNTMFPVMKDSLDIWDFVPTTFLLHDTNWVSHPDSLLYAPLASDQFNQDFIGIVFGDVSQNWASPGSNSGLLAKPEATVTMQLGEVRFITPTLVEVPIDLDHANSFISVAIDLDFSDDELELCNVSPTELSRQCLLNFYHEAGRLNIALAVANPITDSGSLLILQFKTKGVTTCAVKEKLVINQAWLNDQPIQISTSTSEYSTTMMPQKLEISPNCPNPFNQETIFQIFIPAAQNDDIWLQIYNLQGQIVRTLIYGSHAPGIYTIRWDGKDDRGSLVTTGSYFCVLKTVQQRCTQKFMFLK